VSDVRSDDPTPDQAIARLTIYTDEISAEELASLIGHPPDEAWNRGDPRPPHKSYTTTAISYASKLPEADRAEQHLADLLARIAPFADRVREIAQRPGIDARLKVAYFTEPGNPTFAFDNAALAAIADLGLDLELDIYAL
jgi:hypothetical protein